MLKISKFIILCFFVSVILAGGIIFAGSLTPDNPPTTTMYSIDDIYNLINNNSTTTEANHNIYPSTDTGTPTMYSISELYVALANLINPALTTVTYLGSTPTSTPVSAITKDFTPTTVTGTVTGFTLDDIYSLITENTRPLTPTHTFAPPSEPAGTMHTLIEIYTELSTLIDPATIATGTTYLAVTGTYVRPPEEIDTLNLSSFFPSFFLGICPSPDYIRSTTIGPYPYEVILKAKTDLWADDYLQINDLVVPITGINGYCGEPRHGFTNVVADTEIMRVQAGTLITIINGDTIGINTQASGIISIMRVY